MASPSAWVVIAFWGQMTEYINRWAFAGASIGSLAGTFWVYPRLNKSRERARREREQTSDD